MSNKQKYNEIGHINKDINLLQDLIKKNEKTQNQLKNGLTNIARIRVKNGQRANLSQTKKILNIVQNKIKQTKKNTNLLQNILTQVKKRKRLFEKRTEENSKNAKSFTKSI